MRGFLKVDFSDFPICPDCQCRNDRRWQVLLLKIHKIYQAIFWLIQNLFQDSSRVNATYGPNSGKYQITKNNENKSPTANRKEAHSDKP